MEEMVYCTDCRYFEIVFDIPHCRFQDMCDIYDCEDSKIREERPFYMKKHKLIYISHPYQMKEENKQKVEEIVRKLAKKHPENTYLSPIHAVGFMYDDFDYDTGLNMCLEILKRCDIMYVYGDWEDSRGCKAEIEFCKDNGIPYKILHENGKEIFNSLKWW